MSAILEDEVGTAIEPTPGEALTKAALAILDTWFSRLRKAGLSDRPGQREMAKYIATGLCTKGVPTVEGSTGIGKSYASLMAGLAVMKARIAAGEENVPPILYATGTIALQEQVANKDIPALNKLLGEHFVRGVAKGRGRYYCPHRAMSMFATDTKTMSLFGEDEEDAVLHGDDMARLAAKLYKLFQAKRWDGDFDTLESRIGGEAEAALSTSSSTCLKKKCSCYSNCPFFNTRKALRNGDIVVANHDLLLCDINLGGGRVLPCKPEETIYLLDEAHQFPDKAVNQLGAYFSISGTARRLTSFQKAVNKAMNSPARLPDVIVAQLRKAASAGSEIQQALNFMASIINSNTHIFRDDVWLFDDGCPSALLHPMQRVSTHASELEAALDEVCDEAKDRSELEKLYMDMSFFMASFAPLNDASRMILADDREDAPPTARWIAMNDGDTSIHAFPTFASHSLANKFWSKANSVACFSATMRTLGNFNRFFIESGISLARRKPEPLLVQSGFDYSASGLYLLQDGPAPNKDGDKDAYDELVAKAVVRAGRNSKGGVLVIFNSRNALKDAYTRVQAIDSTVAAMVLKQGDKPRDALLADHTAIVEAGNTSIIFGLASFREGVDLPGRLCSVVIIPKLPFSVPTTPMERARVNWIVSKGGNAFWDYTLPTSSIALTQMVGRLIRTEEDIGVVLILDNRIVKSRYGNALLKNLPPFPLKRVNAGAFSV